jgi:hypothetical protein
VTTVDGLKAALNRSDDKPSLLLINRKGSEAFITMRAR